MIYKRILIVNLGLEKTCLVTGQKVYISFFISCSVKDNVQIQKQRVKMDLEINQHKETLTNTCFSNCLVASLRSTSNVYRAFKIYFNLGKNETLRSHNLRMDINRNFTFLIFS